MKSLRLILAFVVLTLLCSCEHRPLCFDHTHMSDVTVEFVWEDETDPQARVANPSTMVVWFYPIRQGEDDNRIPCRYELPGREGGKVRLEAGPYMCVAFNGDTERNREYGDSFDNLYITTGSDVILYSDQRQQGDNLPYAPGTESHEVRLSADRLWSDRVELFTVIATKPHDAPLHQVVTFYPVESTVNIYVTVNNVKKVAPGAAMRAVITSQSERFHPGPALLAGNPVTVPFNLTAESRADDLSTLRGQLIVFGHCHDTDRQHYVSLYNTDTKRAYHFDVTDQMHTAPDPRNIYIVIDGSEIDPDPGGGLGVEVGEWGDGGNIEIGA